MGLLEKKGKLKIGEMTRRPHPELWFVGMALSMYLTRGIGHLHFTEYSVSVQDKPACVQNHHINYTMQTAFYPNFS